MVSSGSPPLDQSPGLDSNLYRIGQSKVFFRAGVLAHLEGAGPEDLGVIIGTRPAAGATWPGSESHEACMLRTPGSPVVEGTEEAEPGAPSWQEGVPGETYMAPCPLLPGFLPEV